MRGIALTMGIGLRLTGSRLPVSCCRLAHGSTGAERAPRRAGGGGRSPFDLPLLTGGLCVTALFLLLCPCATLEGQLFLNELLAENDRTLPDEEGDWEDWVELFNAGSSPFDLDGYGLSEDPTSLDRWIFPSVEVPARGHLLVFLSGKDRFVPPPGVLNGAALATGFRPSFIAPESSWRYVVADPGAAGPPAGWNEVGFEDGAWELGQSGFGYGDEDDYTELPIDTPAVFIRKTFQLSSLADVSNLVLKIDYDDGFVAYLNGVRVASAFAPFEDPTFQSRASGKREAGTPEYFDLSTRLSSLRTGENVLAVVGLNDTPSSDMSLLPELGSVPSYLHADFKLDKAGQWIALLGPTGSVLDSVDLPLQTSDHSYGRAGDGGAAWGYFRTPTPEQANNTVVLPEPLPDRLLLEPPGGRYSGTQLVSMRPNVPADLEVHYTLDGSAPTATSPLFSAPLPVSVNTTLRAAGFQSGEQVTPVASASYFYGGAYALPLLSISMDPRDYELIHLTDSGRGRAWEREAHMELIDASAAGPTAGAVLAEAGCGLRLHGGASRGGDLQTKKSYRLYFRGEYGSPKLDYPIIPDTFLEKYDKLVLRAGFNDCFRTHGGAAYLRDQLIRDLHEDMGMIVSHGTWCNLFVNMRYRGVFNVVERMDEDFLYPYTGERDWDVIKTGNDVLVGSIDEWQRLHTFAVSNDLSELGSYSAIREMIDVENFTSYMLLNIWAQNHDWPHNNWYAARPRRPEGKWIFLSWDAEFGIGLIPSGFTANSFEFTLGQGGYLRDLLNALLANAAYRDYFIEEADRYVYGPLRPANVIARIRRLRVQIEGDMPEECGLFGRTLSVWQGNVAACEAFASGRSSYFLSSIENSALFTFPEVTTPRITSITPSMLRVTGVETVRLSGARLDASTEVYFQNTPAARVESGPGTALTVTVPFDLSLEGEVIVSVLDPDTGKASQAPTPLLLEFPRPRPSDVEPVAGSSLGGELVRITGEGFLPGIEVRFGGALSPQVTLVEGLPQVLEVITPPGEGSVPLTIINHLPGGDAPALATFSFRFEAGGFLRGDSNHDGKTDISDAIATLQALFSGGVVIACLSAADVNDSGRVDISDPTALLNYLFQGGSPPPPPFDSCGPDPTPDALGCQSTGGPGCG